MHYGRCPPSGRRAWRPLPVLPPASHSEWRRHPSEGHRLRYLLRAHRGHLGRVTATVGWQDQAEGALQCHPGPEGSGPILVPRDAVGVRPDDGHWSSGAAARCRGRPVRRWALELGRTGSGLRRRVQLARATRTVLRSRLFTWIPASPLSWRVIRSCPPLLLGRRRKAGFAAAVGLHARELHVASKGRRRRRAGPTTSAWRWGTSPPAAARAASCTPRGGRAEDVAGGGDRGRPASAVGLGGGVAATGARMSRPQRCVRGAPPPRLPPAIRASAWVPYPTGPSPATLCVGPRPPPPRPVPSHDGCPTPWHHTPPSPTPQTWGPHGVPRPYARPVPDARPPTAVVRGGGAPRAAADSPPSP